MSSQALKVKPHAFKASILIPMYNEAETILFILNQVKQALENIHYEIIIIDDGSTDQSPSLVQKFISTNPKLSIQLISQKNMGKGGAIRTAMSQAQGEILVVQDADLEYDPKDIPSLLKLFEQGEKVVYGSRNLQKQNREHSSLLFYWGGLLITLATNIFFGSQLTDEATGYKLFHADIIKTFNFKHNDFAWEPELTAKILKKSINIAEFPISYKPRSKNEGKKISWKDGVKAIWVLLIERLKK